MPAELEQDRFFAISHELMEDLLTELAVIEREEKSAGDCSLKSLYINADDFFDLKADVARQIDESPVTFKFLQHLVTRELSLPTFYHDGILYKVYIGIEGV